MHIYIYIRSLIKFLRLRTNECEAVTALELYAGNEDVNYMAVGRSSGTVILMCLPTEKVRRVRIL